MYIKNLRSSRTGRPVANQFVVECKDRTYFQSYESLIAVVYWDSEERSYKLALGPDWNYSRTTLKHLYVFLEEYYDSGVNWCKTSIENGIKSGSIKVCEWESELEQF